MGTKVVGIVELSQHELVVRVGAEVREWDCSSGFGEEATEALKSLVSGGDILLLLSWDMVVAGTVPVRRQGSLRRETVGFAFEDVLPLSIDECWFDFIDVRDEVFAVAVRGSDIPEALSNGSHLTCVPSAVLVAQSLAGQVSTGLLLFELDEHLQLFEIRQQRIAGWKAFPVGDLRRELAVRWLNSNEPAAVATVCTVGQIDNPGVMEFNFRALGGSVGEYLNQGVAAIAAGRMTPAINMQAGEVSLEQTLKPISSALSTFLVTTIACLLLVAGLLWERGNAYSTEAEGFYRLKVDLFKEMFPGEPVPTGIRRRLESSLLEKRSLAGGEAQLPADPQIAKQLHLFLTAIPAGMRVRFESLNFDRMRLNATVQTRSRDDAMKLTKSLRTVGFDVPSPGTNMINERAVQFQITATRTAVPVEAPR